MSSKYSKKVSARAAAKPSKAKGVSSNADKETFRTGRAPAHGELIDRRVHVFVDDQNLFYGITNHEKGKDFRIDFGQMLAEVCRDTEGNVRPVASAYIAGVIPDDDSFWSAAEAKGFTVRRGYLGSGNRSKQDDAYLIAEIVETIWSQDGPATIVLVAGDADYVPALMKSLAKGWRNEIAFIDRGISIALEPQVHEFRTLRAGDFELLRR